MRLLFKRQRSAGVMAIAISVALLTSTLIVVYPLVAAEPARPVLPANLRAINIWQRVLGKARAPDPWRAAPCDGTAPLLCVSYRGGLVGTVEMGTYLIESRADLRKKLTAAGIPAKSNYADPKYRSRIASALKAWVEDYYAFFKQDRKPEYGSNITFASQPPTPVTIGKLTGWRYGFAGVKKPDGIHEQRVGYVAFDGKTLYVITTAFDAASETGKFKTLEALQRFEPLLKKLVTGLQLPIAKPVERSK